MRPQRSNLAALVGLILGAVPFALPVMSAEGPPPGDIRRESEELVQRARELKELGRHDEASQSMREAEALRAKPDRGERGRGERTLRPAMGDEPLRDRSPGELPPRGEPDSPMLHAKLHHLHAAIGNLHSAGMHEVAERLGDAARELENQIHRRQEHKPFEAERPGSELESLRAEVQELRHAVRRLNAQFDEFRREQR
ncbi:MAG: hypothetical protein JXQ71_08675 [Verrucomicrobia bacterium]|nr:hypothetical protein [Verrucomicrobiota bacterium]